MELALETKPIGAANCFAIPTARDLSGFRRTQKVLSKRHMILVLSHLQRLSQQDKTLRFGAAVNDRWLASYAARFFERPGKAIGFMQSGRLCALGELRPSISGHPQTCEIGISVDGTDRGRGLGSRLLDGLLSSANRIGYASAELWIDRGNKSMIRLCASRDARFRIAEGSLCAEIFL